MCCPFDQAQCPEYFPGYQAGASLKHLVLRLLGLLSLYFPGYQAGASLKPAIVFCTLSTALLYFPGYQAGASLKLRNRRGHGDAARDFPGYQAGASLKPVAAQVNRNGGEVTSPVTKPGPH